MLNWAGCGRGYPWLPPSIFHHDLSLMLSACLPLLPSFGCPLLSFTLSGVVAPGCPGPLQRWGHSSPPCSGCKRFWFANGRIGTQVIPPAPQTPLPAQCHRARARQVLLHGWPGWGTLAEDSLPLATGIRRPRKWPPHDRASLRQS